MNIQTCSLYIHSRISSTFVKTKYACRETHKNGIGKVKAMRSSCFYYVKDKQERERGTSWLDLGQARQAETISNIVHNQLIINRAKKLFSSYRERQCPCGKKSCKDTEANCWPNNICISRKFQNCKRGECTIRYTSLKHVKSEVKT